MAMTPDDVRKIIGEYNFVTQEDVKRVMAEQEKTFEAMRTDTREIVAKVTSLGEGVTTTSALFDQKAATSFAQMEDKVADIQKS